jgi:hypothetical protein
VSRVCTQPTWVQPYLSGFYYPGIYPNHLGPTMSAGFTCQGQYLGTGTHPTHLGPIASTRLSNIREYNPPTWAQPCLPGCLIFGNTPHPHGPTRVCRVHMPRSIPRYRYTPHPFGPHRIYRVVQYSGIQPARMGPTVSAGLSNIR